MMSAIADLFCCAYARVSGADKARGHWEAAENDPNCLSVLGHRIVALIEQIPLLGKLAALIEEVVDWAQTTPAESRLLPHRVSVLDGTRVARIGLDYIGRFFWTQDNNDYVNSLNFPAYNYIEGDVASDFKLLFCQRATQTPIGVFNLVEKLYEQTKLKNLHSELDNYDPRLHELRMSCWEFCFLCLLEGEVISKEQVNKVCIIMHELRQKNRDVRMVDALLDPSQTYELEENWPSNPPAPGDILLFVDKEKKPWHAMVSTGDGNYVDLVFYYTPQSVQQRPLLERKDCIIWRIPFQEIPQNIERFIAEHADLLEQYQSISSAELEDRLQTTQRGPKNLEKLAALLEARNC